MAKVISEELDRVRMALRAFFGPGYAQVMPFAFSCGEYQSMSIPAKRQQQLPSTIAAIIKASGANLYGMSIDSIKYLKLLEGIVLTILRNPVSLPLRSTARHKGAC